MRASRILLSLVLTSLLETQGCVPVDLTPSGAESGACALRADPSRCAPVDMAPLRAGAGVPAGKDVSYTADSVAHKTFTTPIAELQTATIATLERMDIEVKNIAVKESPGAEPSRRIEAVAGDRSIEIELEQLSSQTTRMRVNAKRSALVKDLATATEIIVQTEQTIEDKSKLAQSRMPASPAFGSGVQGK